jgi:hypothetical protein
MFFVHRHQFPNCLLTPDAVEAAAELWVGWYRQARQKALWPPMPQQAAEVRLWGFAASDGPALEDRLNRVRTAAGLTKGTVERPDPDTLVFHLPSEDFAQALPLAVALRALQAGPLVALAVMVRITIAEWRGAPHGQPAGGATLVLCGQLTADGVLLKAVWPANLAATRDQLHEYAVWTEEARFLDELDEYRQTGRLHGGWGGLFPSRRQEGIRDWLLKRLVVLPGAPRLRTTLLQGLFFALLLALAIPFRFLLHPLRPGGLVAVNLLCVGLLGLGYLLLRELRRLRRLHALRRAGLMRIYAHPLRHIPVDLEQERAFADPTLRKYSREIEAQGGQHYADVCIEPRPVGRVYTRVYALSREQSYVLLNLMHATQNLLVFPARPVLMAATYFTDGRRLLTFNEGSPRSKRHSPNTIPRCFPDARTPGPLLAAHRQAREELLTTGMQPAPLMDAAALFARMAADHEEARATAARRGYFTWLDAVREAYRSGTPHGNASQS